MAIYTILLGVSIFLIAMVVAVIKKMFFYWKEDQRKESILIKSGRPAVCVIIYNDQCVIRKRTFLGQLSLYDVLSKSDITLKKVKEPDERA